jgi:ribosomal RNA-processing protein 12
MISATVKGLARLAYEFSDLVLTAFDLLPSTFVLLEKKNREITKVCFIFLFCWLNTLRIEITFPRAIN